MDFTAFFKAENEEDSRSKMNVTLYTVIYLPIIPLNALHANSINPYSMYYIITYTVKKG
jgi:hypothetical protein